MNFKEAESYLLSLGNEISTLKLGLDNIRTLLQALGHPENNYLKVQVAGTNGKGSVCAFLEAMCVSAGTKTGLYTSPHLVSITERIRVDGREISHQDFAQGATGVRDISEALVKEGLLESLPTYFEQVTAIALAHFANADAEVVILETGLGGRFDATTAANAELAGITQIAFDHQKYLGDSIAEIASEKAAIIRPDTKLVVGEQAFGEALVTIMRAAEKKGVVPEMAGDVNAEFFPQISNGDPVRFSFRTKRHSYPPITLALRGRHQVANAKIAVLLAESLQKHFYIQETNIIEGLHKAVHPGRLEFQGRLLFDGAHNTAGAQALADFLDESEKRPVTMIFGVMDDKNVAEMAEILFPRAARLILTQPSNSRGMTADEILASISPDLMHPHIITTDSPAEALKLAYQTVDSPGIICVTGSLDLVGEVKKILDTEKTETEV